MAALWLPLVAVVVVLDGFDVELMCATEEFGSDDFCWFFVFDEIVFRVVLNS
jgi:hypothetical protein